MNIASLYKTLCLPSKVYLVLSIIAIVLTILLPALFGSVSLLMHLVHLIYVVFWTWILHLICRAGYKWISWVLVLTPYIVALLFVTLTLNADYSGSPSVIVVSQ